MLASSALRVRGMRMMTTSLTDPTVKFVLEFFFTNFWHWLGLFLIIIGAAAAARENRNG